MTLLDDEAVAETNFMACNTLHADKKSYIGIADFHRIVLYDYYISFDSLELSGNKRIQ